MSMQDDEQFLQRLASGARTPIAQLSSSAGPVGLSPMSNLAVQFTSSVSIADGQQQQQQQQPQFAFLSNATGTPVSGRSSFNMSMQNFPTARLKKQSFSQPQSPLRRHAPMPAGGTFSVDAEADCSPLRRTQTISMSDRPFAIPAPLAFDAHQHPSFGSGGANSNHMAGSFGEVENSPLHLQFDMSPAPARMPSDGGRSFSSSGGRGSIDPSMAASGGVYFGASLSSSDSFSSASSFRRHGSLSSESTWETHGDEERKVSPKKQLFIDDEEEDAEVDRNVNDVNDNAMEPFYSNEGEQQEVDDEVAAAAAEAQVVIPYRWDRSASMPDLSFQLKSPREREMALLGMRVPLPQPHGVQPAAHHQQQQHHHHPQGQHQVPPPLPARRGSVMRVSPPPIISSKPSSDGMGFKSLSMNTAVPLPSASNAAAAAPAPVVHRPVATRGWRSNSVVGFSATTFMDHNNCQDAKSSADDSGSHHLEKKRERETASSRRALPAPDLRRSCADIPTLLASTNVVPECAPSPKPHAVRLPLVTNLKHDGIQTISCATVVELLQGKYSQCYRHVFILDCRFDYEYEGGHIRTAIHANDPNTLIERFYRPRVEGPVCFVFHCEFSSKRGPAQYRFMRELDRKANQDNYPNLFYPDLYLMENGYCQFFEKFPECCEPQQYIRMDDDRFRSRLKDNFKLSLKKRKSEGSLDISSVCSGKIDADLSQNRRDDDDDDDDDEDDDMVDRRGNDDSFLGRRSRSLF